MTFEHSTSMSDDLILAKKKTQNGLNEKSRRTFVTVGLITQFVSQLAFS